MTNEVHGLQVTGTQGDRDIREVKDDVYGKRQTTGCRLPFTEHSSPLLGR